MISWVQNKSARWALYNPLTFSNLSSSFSLSLSLTKLYLSSSFYFNFTLSLSLSLFSLSIALSKTLSFISLFCAKFPSCSHLLISFCNVLSFSFSLSLSIYLSICLIFLSFTLNLSLNLAWERQVFCFKDSMHPKWFVYKRDCRLL